MGEDKIRELVENFGIFYRKTGHQPMMGRILGYLMVSEPPYRTFEEIAGFLSASKSSVSTALNMLMALEAVDYRTLPGDRKRYFQVSAASMENLFMRQAEEILKFRSLLKLILENRSDTYPEVNNEIKRLILFMDIYEKELPVIIRKWNAQSSNQPGS